MEYIRSENSVLGEAFAEFCLFTSSSSQLKKFEISRLKYFED